MIDGATDAMYTPVPADIRSYLRATVTYTDPEGSGKSEMAVSDRKVLADAEHEHRFPCSGTPTMRR